jgi:hypothetical protein
MSSVNVKERSNMNISPKEIEAIGMTRLEFAEAIGMTYTNLCNKMNNFSPWNEDDFERARAIVDAKTEEKKKKAKAA